jgi:adenine phosphoribosyltransferase
VVFYGKNHPWPHKTPASLPCTGSNHKTPGNGTRFGRNWCYTLGTVKTHFVQIGALGRELPIIGVAPGVSVALLNLLGDTALTEEAGKLLAARLPANTEVLVTPEVKAVPLTHVISRETGLPYIVARKTNKPYMVSPVVREVISITTGKPQLLVIDGADIDKVKGKGAVIIDDVVSTGGTLRSLSNLIAEIGGSVVGTMAVFTEGDERPEVIALGHLPLYTQ